MGLAAKQIPHSPVELAHLGLIQSVVETQHGRTVGYFDKSLARLPAYTLRRRVRHDRFGMLRLKLLQAAHHAIVFRVRSIRLIQNVVQMLVTAQRVTQIFDFFSYFLVHRLYYGYYPDV